MLHAPIALSRPRAIALFMLCLCGPGVAAAHSARRSAHALTWSAATTGQTPTTQAAAATTGRVVVTIVVEGLRIPAVNVELRDADRNVSIARTISDTIGQVTFPDVPAGRYLVKAVREGFADSESAPFAVQGGEIRQVLVEMRLTFVRESVEVVVPANSPTESLQPVAVSDLLTGAKMDIQPLAGDDFQSLLTVLPSIIRGPDGRLRIKGGAPTTGALQMSSASLNDPSTGDFDLELPSGAVESVEVLSNPFAAEYGRFSTSVTQVRTKRGTDEWVFKPNNLMPGFGKGFAFVNKFEPRFSNLGAPQTRPPVAGPVLSVPLRPHRGQEPARRAPAWPRQLRLVHAARRHIVVAACAHRRGHLLPAQNQKRDNVDVSPTGDDAEVLAGGLRGGPGRSAHSVKSRRARVDVRLARLRGRLEDPGRAADGLRAAGAERKLLQQSDAQREQSAGGGGAYSLEG